jgi:hypothetical protein
MENLIVQTGRYDTANADHPNEESEFSLFAIAGMPGF